MQEEVAAMEQSRRTLVPLLRHRRLHRPCATCRHRRLVGRQSTRLVSSVEQRWRNDTAASSPRPRPPADRHRHTAGRRRRVTGGVADEARAHAEARRAAVDLDRRWSQEQNGDGKGGPSAAWHRSHVPASHLCR